MIVISGMPNGPELRVEIIAQCQRAGLIIDGELTIEPLKPGLWSVGGVSKPVKTDADYTQDHTWRDKPALL